MSAPSSRNSLNTLEALVVGTQVFTYYSLKAAEVTLGDLSHLPCCMRVLLENLLRNENDTTVTVEDMRTLTAFHALHKNTPSFCFSPARLLMNDETGVSVLADLACLQDSLATTMKDPVPLSLACPTDVVIDHTTTSLAQNKDRYALLKWSETNLADLRVIPPGNGVGNQINLDVLTSVVRLTHEIGNEVPIAVPDTVMGTDRRISSVNSLGVLGWNTDALEIEGILLGYSSPINLPGVIGLRLTDDLRQGTTATDVALALTKVLMQNNCKDKIVEFYGSGLDHLTVPDRAVIASLVSSCGALCTYFPIDRATLDYLAQTGATPDHMALVEAYAKAQGLWREDSPASDTPVKEPAFTMQLELSLENIRPALGGPLAIATISPLSESAEAFLLKFPALSSHVDPLALIKHGDILLAALSSWGNTAHPLEMALAGLVARKAIDQGLKVKPWVRTVMANTSPVITSFLHETGLLTSLETLGFQTTEDDGAEYINCPPVPEPLAQTIAKNQITVCSITSGVRETNGPLHPLAKAHYVASPALVVVYALTGTIQTDLTTKPLGTTSEGIPVLLKDIWPTTSEINELFEHASLQKIYHAYKQNLFKGTDEWDATPVETNARFVWNEGSSYVRCPPFLKDVAAQQPKLSNIKGARVILLLGDDVPAQTLSKSGPIPPDSPAGIYLTAHGETPDTLQTFGLRTGNYEVMVRGAFTDNQLKNNLLPATQENQALAIHRPSQAMMPVFDLAEHYNRESTPMVIVAGKNFGTGHHHEWAAKSIQLLGIKTVLAESFDPIFRLSLVRLGVLPLQLKSGVSLADLKLTGDEMIHIVGISDINRPHSEVMVTIEHPSDVERYIVVSRIDTQEEVTIFTSGSLLAAKLRKYLPLAV